jgi:hypothetical protein
MIQRKRESLQLQRREKALQDPPKRLIKQEAIRYGDLRELLPETKYRRQETQEQPEFPLRKGLRKMG